ncbi:hypothetical protein [Helicobacter saguini]|nr:hypothetical protein [Helicobacter saguini]
MIRGGGGVTHSNYLLFIALLESRFYIFFLLLRIFYATRKKGGVA